MNPSPDDSPPPANPEMPPPPAAMPDAPGGDAGPADLDEHDDDGLSEWKNELRRDFEVWLASVDRYPGGDEEMPDEAADTAPDLYSFYEQFAAAGAESRRANRRTAEAMSRWGETLARFEGGLQPLRDAVAQLAVAQPKAGRMARSHCLLLVELLERMHRLDRAFASPPVARQAWWGGRGDRAWREAWDAQHRALDILVGHLEGLLAREGVVRIETAERPFDPATMMAVAAEPDVSRPPQTVVEEVAAGYLRDGELLRAAQVKVSLSP